MKAEHFVGAILACCIVVCCMLTPVAAIGHDAHTAETYAVRATGRFSMDVPANTAIQANSSFSLEVGESVTIKATYSPFSAAVEFGLIAPDGLFYGLPGTNGTFDETFVVDQRGQYFFAVRNNSANVVSVSGYVNY